jgi:hypothetical protein
MLFAEAADPSWQSAIVVINGRFFCEVASSDTSGAERVVCCFLLFVTRSALNNGLYVVHLQGITADPLHVIFFHCV